MWYVALGWHAIEFDQTSAILQFYIWFRFWPHHRSRHVSAPVSEVLSKSDHPRQKKMTSCRFSRWRISAIFYFRDPIMEDRCTRPVVSAYAAWQQMVPICTERWCTEANEANQTHCYNPVTPAYPVWAYYAHGRQRRCQEDPVSLPSGRLEKTTRSSPHHVAQYHPTGFETTPPYTPRSSRFGSEPPSVEDNFDVLRYAILELHARNDK